MYIQSTGGPRRVINRLRAAAVWRRFLREYKCPERGQSRMPSCRRVAYLDAIRNTASSRPWESFGSVGEMTAGPCRFRRAGAILLVVLSFPREAPLMPGPIRPIRIAFMLTPYIRFARSGPIPGALGNQLGALDRRRRLQTQQQQLQTGATDYQARPPYPNRPRPPS